MHFVIILMSNDL